MVQAVPSEALKQALSSVERTSIWVAYERAIESDRSDALFRDPLAQLMVGQGEDELAAIRKQSEDFSSAANAEKFGVVDGAGRPWEGFHIQWMAVRTAFIDAWLASSGSPASGSIGGPYYAASSPQLVNIGAGMDTRPFRLPCLIGRTVIEVDSEGVIASKLGVFAEGALGAKPLCESLSAVARDRADPGSPPLPEPLPGHDARRPTDWLAEGLLPYLPLEAQLRLLAGIDNASAPGSRACLNYMEAPEWMPTLTPELLAKALPSWDITHHRFGDATLNFGRVPEGVLSKKLSFAVAVKLQ